MNFLDAYDIASPPMPSSADEQPTQSLNEEVTQVVGQLSRFWGGFRKQSQTAFEAAKKDLGVAYSQATKEISKLTNDATASGAPAEAAEDHSAEPAAKATTGEDGEYEESKSLPNEDTETEGTPNTTGHARTASQNLFSRLQASLPPNLVSSVQNVQNQLPEAFKHAPTGSIDFTQLRTTLTTEFQRVQGITRTQAEEYVHKSEGLLREAGEFFKDAVKVVPPEEAADSRATMAPASMLWDGSDFWMIPDSGGSEKGKERERGDTASVAMKSGPEGLRAVTTRAESLLKQLRHDPEVIKVDPMADERAKPLYEEWIREKLDTQTGGISGEHWVEVVQQALGDSVDGSALQATLDALVPEHMTNETFWTRYFFRVHQVERDEERRRAIIQGTMVDDEDFSWDDEDEATSPTTAKPFTGEDAAHPLQASIATLQAPSRTQRESPEQPSPQVSEAEASRRQSSEDSYDVVSSQVSTSGDPPVSTEEKKKKQEEGDDADSDWE